MLGIINRTGQVGGKRGGPPRICFCFCSPPSLSGACLNLNRDQGSTVSFPCQLVPTLAFRYMADYRELAKKPLSTTYTSTYPRGEKKSQFAGIGTHDFSRYSIPSGRQYIETEGFEATL